MILDENKNFAGIEGMLRDITSRVKAEIEKIWQNQQTPVLDIDVKGAIHVQGQFPQQTLSLFIQPPSITELKNRLQRRGTETEESLQARINKAAYEISFSHSFNHVIVNEDLSKACAEAEALVKNFLAAP